MIILKRRKEFSVQAGLAAGWADKDNININTPLLLLSILTASSLTSPSSGAITPTQLQTPQHHGHCDQTKEIHSTDTQQKILRNIEY